MSESETVAAIRRAGRRAGFHLLRAAVESLKAIEVVVDELATVRRDGNNDEEPPRRERIEVE
jgi:hypothetical protein